MSSLIAIEPTPTSEPRLSEALPERLIAGHPAFKTWAQDEALDGLVKTGVWEATPGETRSARADGSFEFCHILSGVVELTEAGGATRTFRAGDSFVLKAGWVGVWKTVETVRKIYVCVG